MRTLSIQYCCVRLLTAVNNRVFKERVNVIKLSDAEERSMQTHAAALVEGDVEFPISWLDVRVVSSPSRPLSGLAYFLHSVGCHGSAN